MKGTHFNELVEALRAVCTALPDRRTGKNRSYTMEDFALSAFAVFFTQSPSFLAHQRAMQTARGHNNARSFFEIEAIPCDNQIRQVLDAVPPESLDPVYDRVYETLRAHGILARFRGVQGSTFIALDGTWYFASQKLHCPCCSHLEHKTGEITYYHSAVTPVLVAPGSPEVIALRPQFITPQDGHTKQDCEIAAAKRWLEANAASTLLPPHAPARLSLSVRLQTRVPRDALPVGQPPATRPRSGPLDAAREGRRPVAHLHLSLGPPGSLGRR
jgi:hypothetical protein